MKHRVQLLILFLLTVSALLTACSEEAKGSSEPGVVPNSLQTIEAAAEDIIDYAPSGNWDKISADVSDIENAWKSYQPQSEKDGASQEIQNAMTTAIEKLQAASGAKDAAATMQGSNDVSAAVVEMFALYNPKIPADIGRLDVLERQVILDVAAKDYSAATKSLSKTMSVWRAVKPSVLEHNGKDVAAQFDATLEVQAVAVDSKNDAQLTNEAKNGLEIVDALEQLYR